ncbi:MAG: selenium metabolism-associated LysR family transcriptional regulator [Eubacteriales bacterium]|nr:selenium metabolism-associated LysR family transcriptional regulator [Eubacteriales bacterium]
MNINQIESFIRIAQYGSFSAAAKILYISQPTISQQIKALEAEVGAELLIRSGKNIVLSDAGKCYFDYAKKVIDNNNLGLSALQEFTHSYKGVLNIASSTVPAQYTLPQVIADMHTSYPGIKYNISQMDSDKVIDTINEGIIEIGVTSSIYNNTNLQFIPFSGDHFVLIAPRNSFFLQFKNKKIPNEILFKQNYVWRHEGSIARKTGLTFLKSIGFNLDTMNIVAEVQTTESIIHAVSCGLGLSVLSKVVVDNYANKDKILVFDYDSQLLDRTFFAIFIKQRILTPISKAFIDFISNNDKKYLHK